MKPYCHSDMKPMKSPLTMVTEGTIPYSNSLTFRLSYPSLEMLSHLKTGVKDYGQKQINSFK